MDRVLYILPKPGFFSMLKGTGGHVAHAYGIIQGLSQAGFFLDVVVGEDPPSFVKAEQCGIHIYPVRSGSLLRRQLWNAHLIRKVRANIEAWRPIFCYTRYSTGFAPWIPCLKKALGSIPLVLEVNSFAAQHLQLLKWVELRGIRTADLLVTVSRAVEELMEGKLSRNLRDKIIVMPNAVDIARFEKLQDNVFPPHNGYYIGYTGSLEFNYGLEILIKAFSLVRKARNDVYLHIYGTGPFQHQLETLTQSTPGIIFHGPVPFDNMPRVLKQLDILIQTTTPKNSFQSPIKLFEYMASGKPIIAARTPGIEEILGREEKGLMFIPEEAEDLARKIHLLLNDSSLSQQLAARALAEVATNHTWKIRVESLVVELKHRGLIND